MSSFNDKEKRYADFWRSIANFLKNNSGFAVGGVARAGSRAKGTHHTNSDLDIIFFISGDPPKTAVYPQLVEKLKKGLNVRADIGSSGNVINIWDKGISCDLVLRKESDFHSELNSLRYTRI